MISRQTQVPTALRREISEIQLDLARGRQKNQMTSEDPRLTLVAPAALLLRGNWRLGHKQSNHDGVDVQWSKKFQQGQWQI